MKFLFTFIIVLGYYTVVMFAFIFTNSAMTMWLERKYGRDSLKVKILSMLAGVTVLALLTATLTLL